MRVTGVDHAAGVLTVERGFVRPAVSHDQGERIAAHISFWLETWVMNVSMLCPLYDTGNGPERWIDWALRNDLSVDSMDGFIIDRLEGNQSWLIEKHSRTIDPDCSNTRVDDGYEAFDAAWKEGVIYLLSAMRSGYDGKYLIANSSGSYQDFLNGSIYESCPGNWSDSIPETYNDWAKRVLGNQGYITVSSEGNTPNFSLVETYELEEYTTENPMDDPSFVPNYQRMRFGITTSLLGNGYFSYEININGHGSLGLLWFDEYDNAGSEKSYLGYPTSDSYVVRDYGQDGKVFRRDYEKGTVLCNPSDREATVVLNESFRLINGTQQPGINTSEPVGVLTIAPRDGRILLRSSDIASR
jgi:hypothetical protein